jgi:ubiquitin-protein ligase
MNNQIIDFFKTFDSREISIKNKEYALIFTINNNPYTLKFTISGDKITYLSDDDNINNIHFANILNKSNLNNINQIPDIVEFMVNLNIKNYCVSCTKKLDFQSEILISCGDNECLYKYEEIVTGNTIIEKFKEDDDKCRFLIISAFDAINSERRLDIFEPFPTHFLKYSIPDIKRGTISKLEGKNYDSSKDFDRLSKIINGFNVNHFSDLVAKSKSDEQIFHQIGKDLYILLRFILMSCKVDIKLDRTINDKENGTTKIYTIIQQLDKEQEFKKMAEGNQNGFLFHGSNWCNWYSILRNGLKNCSGSKLMTAGAAYGNGIYLSDNTSVSYNYGSSKYTEITNCSKNIKSVIGVFEVINKQKYFKSKNIFVVDDDQMLIQRYLIIISGNRYSDCTSFLNELNKLFNVKIHEEILNTNIKYNKKSIAKIVREYKQLSQINPKNSIFRIEVNPDFPFEWKIFITKFDEKYPITQDMKKFGIKEIELEIKFPENYPFSPPFLRVVSPRFMQLTGHITSGGSICQEILTEKGWLPTCSIESLVVLIISEILEGGGRIDPQKYHIPYTINEAKESFVRVAKSHGWM